MPTFHPYPNDDGDAVVIRRPSTATPLSSWEDATQAATVVPGGALPASLNGIALAHWDGAPTCTRDWSAWTAHTGIDEPPFDLPPGFAAAAGAVIVEDDGRVWLVAPSNAHGGYTATFPKGRVDPGTSLACAAVREAFEESGLQVRITGFLLDTRRTQTYTRYYLARRVGGSPSRMGWESQAVHLVPLAQLRSIASHPNDEAVIRALEHALA